MLIVPRLDLMIAYSCNISCAGCISLSDFKRNGIAPYNDIKSWIDIWSTKLQPQVVAIFGGEPCLHPGLIEICLYVRQQWPTCKIRLITNGYLLDNFDSGAFFNIKNFEIQVSVHRKDHESIINDKIKKILLHRKSWKVKQIGGEHHKQIEWVNEDLTIYKSIFKDFVIPYRLDNKTVVGWNSDPAESHKICGSPSTPILFKGKLYKCPPVANIIDIAKHAHMNYTGYDVNDDLSLFVDNIGKPESVCSFCPEQQHNNVINHLDIANVQIKQKNFS
jgi:organic radical activating enzyme